MDYGHWRECLGLKGKSLSHEEKAQGKNRGGQVRRVGGIQDKWGLGVRCLVDSLPLLPQLGPYPGSIPANSLGPFPWGAGLEREASRKLQALS